VSRVFDPFFHDLLPFFYDFLGMAAAAAGRELRAARGAGAADDRPQQLGRVPLGLPSSPTFFGGRLRDPS
jgi:hypothetical protein